MHVCVYVSVHACVYVCVCVHVCVHVKEDSQIHFISLNYAPFRKRPLKMEVPMVLFRLKQNRYSTCVGREHGSSSSMCVCVFHLQRKPNALFDSSKFIPLDPTQEPIFPPSLMVQKLKSFFFVCVC